VPNPSRPYDPAKHRRSRPDASETPIQPGLLDREIILQVAVLVQSTTGDPQYDWEHATSHHVWAQWLPGSTREAWEAQQRLASFVDGVYRIYYLDPEPTPENTRVIGHTGRVYDLRPPIEIGRRLGLDLPVVARGEVVDLTAGGADTAWTQPGWMQ